MSDDVLDNIIAVIVIMIIGAVVVVIGLFLQSIPIVLLGGTLVGAVPIIKLVMTILK